jgi:hypothetical protein
VEESRIASEADTAMQLMALMAPMVLARVGSGSEGLQMDVCPGARVGSMQCGVDELDHAGARQPPVPPVPPVPPPGTSAPSPEGEAVQRLAPPWARGPSSAESATEAVFEGLEPDRAITPIASADPELGNWGSPRGERMDRISPLDAGNRLLKQQLALWTQQHQPVASRVANLEAETCHVFGESFRVKREGDGPGTRVLAAATSPRRKSCFGIGERGLSAVPGECDHLKRVVHSLQREEGWRDCLGCSMTAT